MTQMIQNFDVKGGPEFGRRNIPKLRKALSAQGLDGLLIPHEDEYNNEYLPACNERLMWASGFTGSAGAAVVMTDKAAIFVDGRYTLQVRAQVDEQLFAYQRLESSGLSQWLRENVTAGQIIGYDPRLHSPVALKTLSKAIKAAGGTLRALDTNPIDQAWDDRPDAPLSLIHIQPAELAGESHTDKRARIAKVLKEKNADATLITAPASIAWLLNIRGGDVMCTPLPLSTLILRDDGQADLFINDKKLDADIRSHLGNAVHIRPESDIEAALTALGDKNVIVDPSTSSAWYFLKLEQAGATIIRDMDPVALPKACKNNAEITATSEAHVRDGTVMARFLHWLDTHAQSGTVDEIEAAQTLERFRHETGKLKDLSFETISGSGPNGAMPHYRVNADTVRKLERGTLYLVDSGGQYQDGTTDITRTVPIGTPSQEMKNRFTLVLKGHIALSIIRFPEGTTGSNLDVLARMALWQSGLDFDHGTGHGVGVYLGVHEGPQRISKAPNTVALKPGMIVSNEPGYYKDGDYGIRIENLQYVTQPANIPGGERPMMGFEYITLAPIHRDLIDVALLNDTERQWLNQYHEDVWQALSPRIDAADVKQWLKQACAPL